jgi:hypothetical protein
VSTVFFFVLAHVFKLAHWQLAQTVILLRHPSSDDLWQSTQTHMNSSLNLLKMHLLQQTASVSVPLVDQ